MCVKKIFVPLPPIMFEEQNKGFWSLIYVDSTNRAINPDHTNRLYAYYCKRFLQSQNE